MNTCENRLSSPLFLSRSAEQSSTPLEASLQCDDMEDELWTALNREFVPNTFPPPQQGSLDREAQAVLNRAREKQSCGLFLCSGGNTTSHLGEASILKKGVSSLSHAKHENTSFATQGIVSHESSLDELSPMHVSSRSREGGKREEEIDEAVLFGSHSYPPKRSPKKRRGHRRRSMGDDDGFGSRRVHEAEIEVQRPTAIPRRRSWVQETRIADDEHTPKEKCTFRYKLALNELPVDAAKADLLAALDIARGEPEDPNVIEAAKRLAREARDAQPIVHEDASAAAANTRQAIGTWKALTRAHFPGTLGPDPVSPGAYLYTLGRMSFGLFAPNDLVVSVVNSCQNLILPLSNDEKHSLMIPDAVAKAAKKNNTKRSVVDHIRKYQIIVRFTVRDKRGYGLQGTITTYGYCAPAEKKFDETSHRLSIWFIGGDLSPDPFQSAQDELNWSNLFGTQAEHDIQHRGFFSRATLWLVSAALGIKLDPIDRRGYQSYSIQRPVLGFVDILYADEDFRVTRGNRNTLVVLKRIPKNQQTPHGADTLPSSRKIDAPILTITPPQNEHQ